MKKKKQTTQYFLFFYLISFYCSESFADKFYLSQSQYALCTTAKCFPIPGQEGMALCNCKVEQGYSAGQEPGEPVKTTSEGYKFIKSRYYPIETYVKCSNSRPWAFCLDSPCLIDENDPSKAVCTCSIVQNQGDYILPSDTCDQSLCETGLYSSALTTQDDDIEAFLNKAEHAGKFPAAQKKLCK